MHARLLSIGLLLSTGVVWAQQGASSTDSAESALEAAKRDLRSLPAAERQLDSHGRSILSGATMPALTVPNLAPSPPPSNPAESPTWLKDSLDQTERLREAELKKTTRESDEALSRGERKANGADPFQAFLTQWLAPRDLAILRPEADKTTGARSPNGADLDALLIPKLGELDAQGVAAPAVAMGPKTPAPNPYLQDLALPERVEGSPKFNVPEADRSLLKASTSLLPSQGSTPPAGSLSAPPSAPRPAVAPVQARPAPPTDPIVNDRKYFPQLRRF